MEELKPALETVLDAALLPFRLARVFAAYLYTVGVATSQSPVGAAAAIAVFIALALCFLCGVYFWGGEEPPPPPRKKQE